MKEVGKKDTIIFVVGFIFFAILIILLRMNPNQGLNSNPDSPTSDGTSTLEEKEEETKKNPTIYDLINTGEYTFKADFIVNGVSFSISGIVSNNQVELQINNNQKQVVSINDLENYHENMKYINISELRKILNLSEYERKDDILTFKVETTDLLDQYHFDMDYDSFTEFPSNSLVVTLKNEYLKKIEADYTNYYKYLDDTNTEFRFTLEFSY